MAEEFKATALAEGVTLIRVHKHDCCVWLVEGKDSALLIDAGLGLAELRAVVESLTALPYKVVNTHGHGDHSGGNYQFDRVYMHDGSLQGAEAAAELMAPFAAPEKLEEIRQKIAAHRTEIEFIAEGYVFDLGGRRLEVIGTPGHTSGDITLYDRESGLLFCGDSVLKEIPVLLVAAQTVSVACYADSMRKLAALEGVKGLCTGHDSVIMPRELLLDCLACAEEILAGTSDGTAVEVRLPDADPHCMRATHGDAVLLYREQQIR